MERQVRGELLTEWKKWRTKAESREEMFPGARDREAFPDGPVLEVRVYSCPAPFVVEAEIDRTIGGLNGRGSVGRYLITPWHAYTIFELRTWVS